ncbi:MAG: TonB-dependent receptor, partial [Muribaculaceae bacterium]|nr:TonB-dependent receptor [Muribaculaceae bacterium]
TDVYSQSITRGEVSVSASNRYGSTDGCVRMYYSWGNHFVNDPRHFHSTDDRFGILAYQNLTPWHDASATIGFDLNSYSGEIPISGGQNHEQSPLGTLPRKSITEYSPYITMAQSFASGQAILSAGLRMSNSDKFDTQWVPQAGIVMSPAHLFTFKLSAAMGYRNPSFRELYLYRMANPDLQPEKMWNFEASVARRFSRMLEVDITVYYSRGSNIIQQVNMHNENTGRFINKGIEVSVKSHPLESLALSATYSLLDTSLDNLTGAPRNQYFLGADWRIYSPLTVSAELKGVQGLYVDKRMKRQNYALLNLKATYSATQWLDIFCRLENITDAHYTINYGYPMPGFTAMGGIKLKI